MPLPLSWNSILPFWRRSEVVAAKYLRSLGFRIVASGYRVREGEVDLIAFEGDVLVFVEVKSRSSSAPPEGAVSFAKRTRITRAARAYISHHKLHETAYRFDIVAVNEIPGSAPECRLLRDAFRLSN
jgi:putative endonuclease